VTADAAAATGIPVGTPVAAGTVDAWARRSGWRLAPRPDDADVRVDDVLRPADPLAGAQRAPLVHGRDRARDLVAGRRDGHLGQRHRVLRGITGLGFEELQAEARESRPGLGAS